MNISGNTGFLTAQQHGTRMDPHKLRNQIHFFNRQKMQCIPIIVANI